MLFNTMKIRTVVIWAFSAAAFLFFLPVTSIFRDAASLQPAGLLDDSAHAAAMPTPDAPVYKAYKGVTIGMPVSEARSKLGKARDTSDAEDYFVLSDTETCQVLYDADKTVKVISVNYIGANPSAPDAKAVFGVEAEPKPDGGVYKMVRYPKVGYWISYNKTAGDNSMVIVTMQKIPSSQISAQ